MSGFSRQNGEMCQCVYCGKRMRRALQHCPYCRESQGGHTGTHVAASRRSGSGGQLRTGLLAMLMAAVCFYFSSSYSSVPLPLAVSTNVTTFLVPLLFLSGLGLTLYSFLRA